jgi:Family of unknown function (DUF5906)
MPDDASLGEIGGEDLDVLATELRQSKQDKSEIGQEIRKKVAELNQTYAFVLVGGKAAVLKEGMSPEGLPAVTLMSPASFNHWLGNQFVLLDVDKKGKETWKPLGAVWLAHRDRRTYEGLVFAPEVTPRGYYNLWKGFAVKPKKGNCSKFLAHIRDNVCRGDEGLYAWVMAWFSDIFQHPGEKKGTSLVIRGLEGTGKTKVGEVIGSLLGSHYVVVSDPRYVTGQFNSHMVCCVLLHAEEAFWAGDHAAEGRLKDLITGHHQFIEYKGFEPVPVRNYLRLFITGNPAWTVPVSLEGRRFGVLEIGENQMQQTKYFAAIDEEMSNGGREALLYHLLNEIDLSKVNLREVPQTDALLEQKLASLTGEQGWWMDILQRGWLPFGSDDPSRCPTHHLFESYIRHASKSGMKRKAIETRVGMFLGKMFGGKLKKHKDEHFTNVRGESCIGPLYEFPKLKDCREVFERLLRQPVKWPEADANWQRAPRPVGADAAGDEVPV